MNNLLATPLLQPLAIGILILSYLLGGLYLHCSARDRVYTFWCALISTLLVVLWFVSDFRDTDFAVHIDELENLVWRRADQNVYVKEARRLIFANWKPSKYPLGVFSTIAPLLVLCGNPKLIPGFVNLMIMPGWAFFVSMLLYLFAGESVERATRHLRSEGGARARLAFTVGVAILSILIISYISLSYSDGFNNEYNVGLGARRLLGLVLSPEPIQYLFVSAAVLLILRLSSTPDARFDPYRWGVFSAWILMQSERSLLLVLPLFAALATFRNRLVDSAKLIVTTVACYLPQYLLFSRMHGEGMFPNRATNWERHGGRWLQTARERYDWVRDNAPPQISAYYARFNIDDVVSEYGWLLSAGMMSLMVLLLARTQLWRAWALCGMGILAHVILVLCYVHINVSFRYLSPILPMIAVSAGAAL